ncbi:hypothetical protein RRG08_034240 [Elysia crispata]|uniref:Uncharacterized protein n=1 Tax=Elysia crispata TaxID=231223 RepID=A0AAE1DQC1_9GAST|nr:hypothetical protein RRG08_034240 [Elysia crispata]
MVDVSNKATVIKDEITHAIKRKLNPNFETGCKRGSREKDSVEQQYRPLREFRSLDQKLQTGESSRGGRDGEKDKPTRDHALLNMTLQNLKKNVRIQYKL